MQAAILDALEAEAPALAAPASGLAKHITQLSRELASRGLDSGRAGYALCRPHAVHRHACLFWCTNSVVCVCVCVWASVLSAAVVVLHVFHNRVEPSKLAEFVHTLVRLQSREAPQQAWQLCQTHQPETVQAIQRACGGSAQVR